MPEKRMVGLIIGAILIAVVAAYFIFKVLGLQPDKDIFPRGKEMLVRYYACSLAICTHGCDWLETNKICLDNDTVTHECNLWCEDVCRNRFEGCNKAGDCCGPEHNLSVSLGGKALFKCYVPRDILGYAKGWAGSDIYNYNYYESGGRHGLEPFYNRLVENEGAPMIIKRKNRDDGETILGENCIDNVNCGYGNERLQRFTPGQMRTENDGYVGSKDPWGVPASCWLDGKGGIGQIFLDENEAYEKYGCTGDCNIFNSPTRFGFDQCLFKGEINIWSDWKNDDCADVFFNSTISGDWGFDIECTGPEDGHDHCYKKINLGETADYTIQITNNLDTGAKFKLDKSYKDDKDAGCTFWDGSEEITQIFVDDEEPKDFTMSCTPTEPGTYKIWIDATTGGRTESTGDIELVVSDFDWLVTPGPLPAEGNEPEQQIGKDGSQKYTVKIDSKMGADTDFIIRLRDIPEGLKCEFDEDDDDDPTKYTLHIPDDGYDEKTFICSGEPGDYEFKIKVEGGGITKPSKTRHLIILECDGEIRIEFEYQDPLTSGKDLTVKATGLSGCEDHKVNISVVDPDLVVWYCGVGGWDGKDCIFDTNANTPGDYTVYAFIDKNDDEIIDPDDGESATATLTINGPSIDDVTYIDPGDLVNKCDYSVDDGCTDICDTCGNCVWVDPIFGTKHEKDIHSVLGTCTVFPTAHDCSNYFDPQTYKSRQGTYAGNSNICCIDPSITIDEYSPGPSNVPCLSPDTNTHHDRTENWWYGGMDPNWPWPNIPGVDNSRNVLVKDYKYATFKYDDCDDNDDCRGTNGGPNPPNSLSSAVCVNNRCRLSDSLPTYTSWLYIRISETSRPVYGVVLRGLNIGSCGSFHVFLHDSNGWFDIGGAHLNQWWRFRASNSGKWSWNSIDSLLIVKADNCDPKFSSLIDYIGLLTKDDWTPFCKEGDANDYYRTVDDGKKCYWNVDCPTSGTGWTVLPPAPDTGSTGVGAFGECPCSSGSCGNGYCEYKGFCYHNVKCANGGWRYSSITKRSC